MLQKVNLIEMIIKTPNSIIEVFSHQGGSNTFGSAKDLWFGEICFPCWNYMYLSGVWREDKAESVGASSSPRSRNWKFNI